MLSIKITILQNLSCHLGSISYQASVRLVLRTYINYIATKLYLDCFIRVYSRLSKQSIIHITVLLEYNIAQFIDGGKY